MPELTEEERMKMVFDNIVKVTAAADTLNDTIKDPKLTEAIKQIKEALGYE